MPYTPTPEDLEQAYAGQALSVFVVGSATQRPDEAPRHSFVHPAFVFATRGAARVTAAGSSVVVRPGTVAHVAADEDAQVEPLNGEAVSYIYITYVAGHHAGAAQPAPFDVTWSFEPDNCDELVERARGLLELGEQPDLESRLNQIIGATAFIKGLFAEPRTQDAPEGLRRARAHIDAHYADPLTLEQLGSIAGLSPKRFSERFQQVYGQRPMSYIITRRVEHAQELLTSNMLVRDVAHLVGYDDQFYFSRIYKKYTGESPEAARRRLAGEKAASQPAEG
jgi:AraC-like DNA-binding protein